MTPDPELLRQFAQIRSEDAFAELVRRHVNLVYSTALRQVGGDAHLAQDVAQTVFADLARKAGPLSRRATLTGWLYTSARFAAAKATRAEMRRRDREEKFMREPAHESAPEADWEAIRPVLDDAMHELREEDREALLLRYFENRPFAEIGGKLGLNENAARMRVGRALELLRTVLAQRGIATTATLATVLSANAVQLAPSGLAATLTAASVAGATASTGTCAFLSFMTASKLQIAVGALVVAGAAATLVVQHQTQAKLRAENQSLRQQLVEAQTLSQNPAPLQAATENSNALTDQELNELLRLRGEVGLLRRQTNELKNQLATAQTSQPHDANPSAAEPAALPEDYPKTADGASRSIFDTFFRGDWDAFFTNFAEPGASREEYDKIFRTARVSNYISGMESVSFGQPTNSFGPNLWFVPYKIKFKNGMEKEWKLHVGQDPKTQRWFFKGGF